ncbi:MAG: hypothetical protein RLZZ312_1507 [Bacteroidota bacterium]
MKKIIWTLLLFTMTFASCESDDICDAGTPTTARVVIEFYNFNNPAQLRLVTNLKVVGAGVTDGIVFVPNADPASDRFFFNETKIQIPLKIDQNVTTYSFILNAKAANPITDVLKFTYTRTNEYVSRACGFRTFFNFNNNPNSLSVNNITGVTSGNWIRDIQILKQTINDETTTHVKIFF